VKLAVCLVFAVSSLVSQSMQAQTKVAVTLEGLLSLKRASDLSLSPDGHFLSFVEGGEVYVCSTEVTCHPNQIAKGNVPQWSPNGDLLAFFQNTDARSTILIWDPKTATLTHVGALDTGATPKTPLWWNPEDNSIEVVSEKSDTADQIIKNVPAPAVLVFPNGSGESALSGLTADSPRGSTLGRPRKDLYLFSSKTGKSTVLLKSSPDVTSLNWSPDGKKLVGAIRDSRPAGAYVEPSSTIFVLDANGGGLHRLRSVATSPWGAVNPRWSPDGKNIAYIASATPYGEDTLFVQAGLDGHPSRAHIKQTGSVMSFVWGGDSKSIVMQVANGVTRPVVRLSIPSGDSEQLNDTEVLTSQFSVSKHGDIAWIESTGSTFEVIRFLPFKGSTSVVLDNLNPQISGWKLGEQDVVRWKNKGGDLLEGILVKPAGYQAGHRYPLIVDPYGNRVNDFKGIPMLANQMLAGKGYALFFPNHRGPQTFAAQNLGNAYSKSSWTSDTGILEVEDILSGVDALIRQGVVDPDRLYLYGVSNGASAVNLLLSRTSIFKAAVSFGGVSDWFNYYMYRPADDWTIPDFLIGKTPQKDLSLYVGISPLYHLDSISTPLLLVTGDKDTRALQAVLFYDGLRRLGKPVTLIRYSAEGHGLSDTNLHDYWARIEKFFSEH